MGKKFWVVAYTHFDYECSDFQIKGFNDKSEAQKFIQKLFDDKNIPYTPSDIHVIYGDEMKIMSKEVSYNVVDIHRGGG